MESSITLSRSGLAKISDIVLLLKCGEANGVYTNKSGRKKEILADDADHEQRERMRAFPLYRANTQLKWETQRQHPKSCGKCEGGTDGTTGRVM